MTIVIIEDHLMFREMLRKVCVDDLGHDVVAEADDGRRAVEVVCEARPDLVLLDLHLPNLDGFHVLAEIRKTLPNVRVLVLSSHCDEYTVFSAEKARVQGFVDKNTNSVAAVKEAITAIGQGRVWFSAPFQKMKAARHSDPGSFDKVLTTRERAILSLFAQSLTDAEMGAELGISAETVEKHRFNLLKKLGLKGTLELTRYARDHGFTLAAKPGDTGALLP